MAMRMGGAVGFAGISGIFDESAINFPGFLSCGTRWDCWETKRHAALYATAVSLDHVVPHSRGGDDDEANLLTVCFCCQHGRGQWLLDEMELYDPRERPPIVDSWDGLRRIEAYPLSSA